MFKNFLCRTCKWFLNKYDKKQNDNSDMYNKFPVNKLQINKTINTNNKLELMNRVIYFFNIGDKNIQPYMKLCIQSYKDNNPNFEFKFLNMTKDDFYNLEIMQIIAEENNINIKDDFYKTLYFFKHKWLTLYGGIWCNLNTYCCRSLEDLLQYDNFVMSKSIDGNISRDYGCMGIKKGLDIFDIQNVIYPPINYDDENYESMRLSFYNGSLNKDMFCNVINKKMHNYIYEFNK